jgi:hypothetical protein
MPDTSTRNYLTVTVGYWAVTITDGAIRMLVVLYFHLPGYPPFEVAMLFLFCEFFGIVTNLVGGWLGAWFRGRAILFLLVGAAVHRPRLAVVDGNKGLAWQLHPEVLAFSPGDIMRISTGVTGRCNRNRLRWLLESPASQFFGIVSSISTIRRS